MAFEQACRPDMISAPVIANTMLISNRELGEFSRYSLQVALIAFFVAVINRVATIEPKYILDFRPVQILVLELRGPNLNTGPVLNYDRKFLAIGH